MSNSQSAALAFQRTTCLGHLGLERDPFPVAPDTASFYQSPRIESLLAEVLHAIFTRKGFLVITGEIGLGKTTISRRLLETLEEHGIESALVFNTLYQGGELLSAINKDFGIRSPGGGLQAQLCALNDFLLERNRHGVNCAIVIDDAQNLSLQSLELVRLISNLETGAEKLVQILLIGQPELTHKLDTPALRQLKSRVVVHARTSPLSLSELKQYVFFKLSAAGCTGCLEIPERSFRLLFRLTGGVPRRVNILMDRCLYAACAAATRCLSPRLLGEAAAELELKPARRFPVWAGAAGAAAMVLAAVVAGAPLLRFPGPQSRPVTGAIAGMLSAPDGVPGPGTARRPPPLKPAAHAPTVPRDLQRFLDLYGVSAYAQDFARALRQDRLGGIAERIASKTGLRLIVLREPPAVVRQRYGLLRMDDARDGPRYALFWKPQRWVATCHYRYQGKEIAAMQRELARLGLYDDTVDGVVDGNLFRALTDFQRARGLTPTGYPDAQTQFLLSLADAAAR